MVLHSTPRVQSPHRERELDGQGKLQRGPGQEQGEWVGVRRGDGEVMQLGHGEQGQSGWLCPGRKPWDNYMFPV